MFGRRADGRRIKGVDPIVTFTPYIMPTRVDSQVYIRINIDFDIMTRYIRSKREEGKNVTYMGLILAAYVRTVAKYPALNRFIMNKQIYARNHVCVSFVTLKKGGDSLDNAVVKVEFHPDDTIFEISDKLESIIEVTRDRVNANRTDVFARTLLGIPGLPTVVIMLARLLDRYGLLPGVIHKASPFHTSLFISNMASIGMRYIYHHLYNFGTTSVFLSMGKAEQDVKVNSDGTSRSRRVMPIGAVIDERICSGSTYSRAFSYLSSCLANPEMLEERPDSIEYETRFKLREQGAQINALDS